MSDTTAEVVVLRNITDVPQHIFVNDRRETIHGQQTRALPGNIAKLFLEQRGKFVIRHEAPRMPVMPGYSGVWLANGTGNPFLPAKISIQVHDKRTNMYVDELVDNPMRRPQYVRERVGQGQVVQPSREGDGEESVNLPKVTVEIPPYERVLVPGPLATVLLNRDDSRELHNRGQVRLCRAPGGFEPNETWGLDEIRTYASLLDPVGLLPFMQSKYEGHIPPEIYFKGNKSAMAEAKKKLLDILFFRLIDEQYTLPTQEEFKRKHDRFVKVLKEKGIMTDGDAADAALSEGQ